jgi:hypothetical protein
MNNVDKPVEGGQEDSMAEGAGQEDSMDVGAGQEDSMDVVAGHDDNPNPNNSKNLTK